MVALLLLLGALALAGCGESRIGYARGAQDIVMQLSGISGGLVPGRLYLYEDQFPAFTLFGDGRLIYSAENGLYQAQLDAAAIERLLDQAVNDVHFFDLPDFVGPTCCDMPNSHLVVTAGGQSKSVGISLLEDKPDANSPERRMQRLIAAINAFRTGADEVYSPGGATVYVEFAADGSGSAGPAWPVPQVSLAAAAKNGQGVHLNGAAADAALQAAPRVSAFVENGVGYMVIAVPDAP